MAPHSRTRPCAVHHRTRRPRLQLYHKPLKNYLFFLNSRSRIKWAKDHKYLENSKKFRISKKGALKVNDVSFRDGGVYTCIAARSTADITLTVKPLPGHFPNSEEIHQAQNNLENPGYHEPNTDSGTAFHPLNLL